jgi:predicted component of type VI protein secretion system
MATFAITMQVGPEPGMTFGLDKNSILLGRDPVCDVLVEDSEVSRRHARLIAQSGGYVIEDLGSTNGTFVNEQRIRSMVPLKAGTTFRLGETITFSYAAIPADKTETRDFAATPPSPSQRIPSPKRVGLASHPVPMRAAAAKAPSHATSEPAAIPVEIPVSEPEIVAPPSRLRPRRKGLRLPIFSRGWLTGCIVVALLGVCGATAAFWYIDANYLWCDVFGTLISACR